MRTAVAVVIAAMFAMRTFAQPHRHALLIGINDYSASHLPPTHLEPVPGRDWANLDGALNDVLIMRDLLLSLKGFAPSDIVVLTDQQATRSAILHAIETWLVAPARRGDVVLFYYSGHGSQVRNSLSAELDRRDESLVPADSRRGAPDIRDKELRTLFNRIIDRGARLTVVLDSCHSASGARGFDAGSRIRGLAPDPRDAADRSSGPRPEDRGALVIAASQDFDLAYEVLDGGAIHGALSWALDRAIRDAPDEPAADIFTRAAARIRIDAPAQQPVLAGDAEARLRPFLDDAATTRSAHPRPVIAIEKASAPGQYDLHGGWANGLTIGSELRVVGSRDARLEVTSLSGVSHATARALDPGRRPLPAGSLLEMVSWAAPPGRPLRVCIPRAGDDDAPRARRLRAEARQRGIRWIEDPTAVTPEYLLRGEATLAGVPKEATLFVQVPATAPLADAMSGVDGVELVSDPRVADYILVGRVARDDIEYAWVRPATLAADGARSALPVRSAWVGASQTGAALALRDALARLARVRGWHDLASPPGAISSYRLAIRRSADGRLMDGGTLTGDERYDLVLRARENITTPVLPRYVYIFVIDSAGNGVLLFPRPNAGSVENRLPISERASEPLRNPPAEIRLDEPFIVTAPFGVDTYFLLTTNEPLGSLAALDWDGVRGGQAVPKTALERLLASVGGRRGGSSEPIRTPADWSLEKIVFESIPPRRTTR